LVDPALDLLDAAVALARDEASQIEAWLREGKLSRVNDETARALVSQPTLRFQFVIVQPWVVAQVLVESSPRA
jgi:hypothetical protein